MKLFLVTENLGSGGAERQLTLLAKALREAGHQPIVITWIDRNFYGDFLKDNKIRHILLHPVSKQDRVRKLASLMREERPSAIISYLPMANETTVLARLLCPGLRTKLIVSERSFTVNWNIRRRVTDMLYHVADYVVANSNNEAENIRRHCPSLAKKTLAIPNMVDIDNYCHAAPRTFNKPLRLVGVGRVIPSKNIENLVRALARVKQQGHDFIFRWYGAQDDEQYVRSIPRVINEYGMSQTFSLHVAISEISTVYAEADAFIFPSFLEGYPNVLVEAMASGLPVAVSDVCEHPHIVTEGVNGFLFDPSSLDSMADAIIRLCNLSYDEALIIGNSNKIKVRTNNSTEAFLNQYMALIER